MNVALIEALQQVARAAEAAPHGCKKIIYQNAATELGMSLATLHRKLSEVTIPVKKRKRRSDAGNTSLDFQDAQIISAYLQESQRANGKRLASIDDAIEVLRANGSINATRLDEETGELIPLSVSAISRALITYRLHPDQLALPTPKTQLASLHPNHVWQIDPSLCVLYYLRGKKGLHIMEAKEFNDNKPKNIEKIKDERIWRYVVTDHTSGWIYVHYVLGAESGKNLVEAFIGATQKRHAEDPVHGIPKMIMVDPGSANTGAVFRNLCNALGITLQVNLPGQPWAKGQVEKANDQVEKSFEHRLTFMDPPTTIEEINTLAWKWMRWFNSTKIHTRTKETRYAVWARITAEQLVIAPSAQVLRELSYSAAVQRKVTAMLTVPHNGKTYSVNDIPDVEVGEWLSITRNPWRDDNSIQVMREVNGERVIHVIEPQKINGFGFAENAATIGENFKSQPQSAIDKNRKAVEQLAMQVTNADDAAAARKAKKIPFGGSIDPMKNIEQTDLVEYLPKRGTKSEIASPIVELPKLNPVQLAKKIALQIGKEWNGSEHFSWLKQRYPEGATEEEIEAVIKQLRSDFSSPLRIVK